MEEIFSKSYKTVFVFFFFLLGIVHTLNKI